MALYRYATQDELANLRLGPTSDQTNIYNALGNNNSANNNFFTKRANSIGNAIGTTGAALISPIINEAHSAQTSNLLNQTKEGRQAIAKKYGYADMDALYDALDAAEASGDTDTFNRLSQAEQEDRNFTSNSSNKMREHINNYNDYVKNNQLSKFINQDRGKFAGSAINTLSTATDLLGLTNGPVFNAIQGGIEGIADELEQNGSQNFDWQRAGQNALTGAASGAVVGGLNNAISGTLAKNGGNLFKGGNRLTQGLNNLGSKTALGRGLSTIGTGVARGAVSGAAGGATGAGLSAAMNGQDILGSALQGAQQGFGQGAMAGGIMAGVNAGINKTPFMQKVNQANQDWQNSGDNFKERWNTTRAEDTWGNRLINRGVEDVNAVKQGFQNVGQGLKTLAGMANETPLRSIGGTLEDVANENIRTKSGFTANELIDMANKQKDKFVNDVRAITQENNGVPDESFFNTAVKTNVDRINQKIKSSGGKTPTDMLRSTIMVTDPSSSLQNILKSFENRGYKIYNNDITNRYTDGSTGYKDIALKFVTGDGDNIVKEIQIMTPNMKKAKYELGGHELYEKVRVKAPGWQEFESKMNKLYADAERADAAALNSAADTSRPSFNALSGGNSEPASVYPATSSPSNTTLTGVPSTIKYRGNSVDVIDSSPFNSSIAQNNRIVNSPETEVFRTISGKNNITDAGDNIKSSKSTKLRNQAAQELLKQYGTIDKPTAKAVNAKETIQKIADAGFTKPNDVERIADNITGSNGEVNKLVAKLIANAKPVDTYTGLDGKNINQFVDEAIARHALVGINEGKAVKAQIDSYLNSLPSRRNGSISGVDEPESVMDVIRGLEAEAANYEGRSGNNYGTTTKDKLNAASVVKDVTTLLKDRLFDTVDVKKVLTPEVATDLKNLAPGNEKWAKYVDDEIMSAKSVQDLRSVQAPWVRAKKIIDNGYMNSMTYGGRMANGQTVPTTKRGVVSNVVNNIINSDIANRGKAKVLNYAANRADRTSANTGINPETPEAISAAQNNTNYNPATQIYNAIGRTEGEIQGQNAAQGYIEQAAQNEAMPSANATDVYSMMYGGSTPTNTGTLANNTTSTGTGTTSAGLPSTGDQWTDIIGAAMMAAAAAGDADAFAQLYGMYGEAMSSATKSSGKDYSDIANWSAGDRGDLLSAKDGLDMIDSLEKSYLEAVGENGGNVLQGTLRGIANNISGGNLDRTASNYEKQASSIGAGIVKNLINLGSTEYDAERYIDYLPKITDTKEQAEQKLQVLRNAYQRKINNLYSVYGL